MSRKEREEAEKQFKELNLQTGIVTKAVKHPYLPLAEKTIWIEFDTKANAKKFGDLLSYARTISGQTVSWFKVEGKRVIIKYEERI